MHFVDDYNDTSRQLPMKVQLPFDTEQSPIFEVLVVTLFLHVMANSFTIALLNGLIFSLVSLRFYIYMSIYYLSGLFMRYAIQVYSCQYRKK